MAQIVHTLYVKHHESFTGLVCVQQHWAPRASEIHSSITKPAKISGVMCYLISWVDKRPSPWSPPVQSAAERCPSAACKLQGSAGGGRQWGKGVRFGRMLTQPRRTPSDKVSKSQQFVRPAEPRWTAGVKFIEAPCNSAAASPLENIAVKGEKRRALRERIKALWRTFTSLIIGTAGKWRKERRGFFLSHGFILHLNFVILLSGSLSPHFL